LQPHVKDVAITCIFTRLQPHQANTNLVAIWQCHDMEFFLNRFIANRTFYLYFCNRNHTAIRVQTITYILVFQLSFFGIAAHQWLQPHVKDVAITCIFTRLQPHQANTNLVAIWQCHGMELFFWTGFLQSHFFYLCFCNCFFAIAVTCCFCNCFFAITLR
jgi:hypothetical protein